MAQEVDQVPALAAPRIEHAAAPIEASLEQLVEQVDVDVAELRAELGTGEDS